MFGSFVIPTIGRPSLERSVKSVLNQQFSADDWEVVVVNDSGTNLGPAEWQDDSRVLVIETQKRERNFARNTGAAVARGRYLCFLDDDDWLLSDALQHFWKLANHNPEAVWLYGGLFIVDENENTIAERNSGLSGNCFAQIMGGAWVPIQASMIEAAAFFQLGGYDPLIMCTEDLDLCCRAAFHGIFANTSAPVACLQRGRSWKTSADYSRAPEDTRYSRDMVLSNPGVFKRIFESNVSCYWRGRVLHVYLSTAKYNLRRSRYLIALSRLFGGALSLFWSWRCVFVSNYWRAVRDDHVPGSLHFVMKEYDEESVPNTVEKR